MYDLLIAERPRASDRAEVSGRTPPAVITPQASAAPIPEDRALIQVLIELLMSAGRRLTEDRAEARSCIGRAISLLEAERMRRDVGHGAPERMTMGGLSPWRIRRVNQYIEENLGATIRVEDLARNTKLSVRHFSSAFRQSFGVPPHVHIVKRRIDEARKLMLLTDKPLAQVALACGMADQAHLSKWFRRLVGVTPNAWRKQNQAFDPAETSTSRHERTIRDLHKDLLSVERT